MTYIAAQDDLSLQKKKLAQEQSEIWLRRFTHNQASVSGLVVVTPVIVLAVFALLTTLHGLLAMNTTDRPKGINAGHWSGTDSMGYDVFARVLYGTRISLTISSTVDLVSGFLGLVIGLCANTSKLADNILMCVCDGLKAIPSTLLAITMMAVLGVDIKNVIVSLIVADIPNMARLARSQALVVKEQTYIEAVRCFDSSQKRILWAHIVPNTLSPMIVQMTSVFASAIITEAALSFLGAGVPAPAPSWDNILKKGKDAIYTAQWMILFPGVFIALAVLGLSLLDDGMCDLMDPKSD